MPVMPSIALTAPSCIAPRPDSDGSSSCSAITPPARRWYWIALRRIPADTTGFSPSGEPSAPPPPTPATPGGPLAARLGDRGEPPPGGAARDRRHEADRDPRVARGGVAQRAQHRGGVDDRVRVRHRDDRAVAARGRRAGAGVDVLLVLLAGHAQVDVRVDEGG